MLAIIAIQSILGSKPDESFFILENGGNVPLRKTVLNGNQLGKDDFLGVYGKGIEQANEEYKASEEEMQRDIACWKQMRRAKRICLVVMQVHPD